MMRGRRRCLPRVFNRGPCFQTLGVPLRGHLKQPRTQSAVVLLVERSSGNSELMFLIKCLRRWKDAKASRNAYGAERLWHEARACAVSC
eukprot:6479852-Alexandrium_andersonii.AAC.1